MAFFSSSQSGFAQFRKAYQYQNRELYRVIFERHSDKIKLSREKFAVKNLQMIFDATFRLVPKIGFQAMSLRDLSAETGLSMGGLYSSISYKENIAIIVKDVVALVCDELDGEVRQEADPEKALEKMVRESLYVSTILQPWFYFLYFETRSLPLPDQEASKNIELGQIAEMTRLVEQIARSRGVAAPQTPVATMLLAMFQERYLKPWKYKNQGRTIDAYADQCLELAEALIGGNKTANRSQHV